MLEDIGDNGCESFNENFLTSEVSYERRAFLCGLCEDFYAACRDYASCPDAYQKSELAAKFSNLLRIEEFTKEAKQHFREKYNRALNQTSKSVEELHREVNDSINQSAVLNTDDTIVTVFALQLKAYISNSSPLPTENTDGKYTRDSAGSAQAQICGNVTIDNHFISNRIQRLEQVFACESYIARLRALNMDGLNRKISSIITLNEEAFNCFLENTKESEQSRQNFLNMMINKWHIDDLTKLSMREEYLLLSYSDVNNLRKLIELSDSLGIHILNLLKKLSVSDKVEDFVREYAPTEVDVPELGAPNPDLFKPSVSKQIATYLGLFAGVAMAVLAMPKEQDPTLDITVVASSTASKNSGSSSNDRAIEDSSSPAVASDTVSSVYDMAANLDVNQTGRMRDRLVAGYVNRLVSDSGLHVNPDLPADVGIGYLSEWGGYDAVIAAFNESRLVEGTLGSNATIQDLLDYLRSNEQLGGEDTARLIDSALATVPSLADNPHKSIDWTDHTLRGGINTELASELSGNDAFVPVYTDVEPTDVVEPGFIRPLHEQSLDQSPKDSVKGVVHDKEFVEQEPVQQKPVNKGLRASLVRTKKKISSWFKKKFR